jgi:hypothetical protein
MKKEMKMNGASPPKLNEGTLARKQKMQSIFLRKIKIFYKTAVRAYSR